MIFHKKKRKYNEKLYKDVTQKIFIYKRDKMESVTSFKIKNWSAKESGGTKIYKELLKFNNKKVSNWLKEWAKHLNNHFTKEETQMANKPMKRCSTAYVSREIKLKWALIRIAKIKTPTPSIGQSVKKQKLFTAGENEKWCSKVCKWFFQGVQQAHAVV